MDIDAEQAPVAQPLGSVWFAVAKDGELRKRFVYGDGGKIVQVKGSGFPEEFRYVRRDVGSMRDLAALAEKATNHPRAAVVLGVPYTDDGARAKHLFGDEPTDLWWIDLDGAPRDERLTVQENIERLLPFLSGRSYVYAFSQSSGIKPDLRLRIVCRVKNKTLAELHAFTREINGQLRAFHGVWCLDLRIYSPSHLIYTARPFLSGMPDPHKQRVFLVEGDESPIDIALPDYVELGWTGDLMSFESLPALRGNWSAEGDGQGRSEEALKAMSRLRTYMGDDWDDEAKRNCLWEQMLDDADASPYSRRTYGVGWLRRRWREARLLKAQRTTHAVANIGSEVPLDEAAAKLRNILADVLAAEEPGVYCIEGSPGLGKTRVVAELLDWYSRRTANGQYRFHELNVDFYVPTIRMAEELEQTLHAVGVHDCFVEYGRGQEFDGAPVCIKSKSAQAIQGIVSSVAEHLCKSGEELCEHYSQCRWQYQRNDTANLRLRIRSHNYLPLVLRGEQHAAYRPVDAVIIDEASFTDALIHQKAIEVDDLLRPDRLDAEHHSPLKRFKSVLESGLSIASLEAEGFDPDEFDAMAKAEDALMPALDVRPSMSAKATAKAVKGCNEHAGWYRFAQTWRQLAAMMRSGSPNRVRHVGERLFLNWKSPIKAIPWDEESGKPKVPVILLSGTMRREVIEQFLPVDQWHVIEVQKHGGARVRMYRDGLRGSKGEGLYGSSEARVEAGEDDERLIERGIEAREQIMALLTPDSVLGTYKELRELLALDDDRAAHFGAVEGRNLWASRDMFLYGRPLPSPQAIEDRARAIFCDGPEIPAMRASWYPSRAVQVRGQNTWVNAPYHPDSRVEAVRWMICEAGVMQMIARTRYLRFPVTVTVLNPMALPIVVDEMIDSDLPRARLKKGKVIPKSKGEIERLLGVPRRSASRFYDPEDEAADRLALLVRYRRKGVPGPMSESYIEGWDPRVLDADLSQFEIVESPHNEWVREMRAIEEAILREPTLLRELSEQHDEEHMPADEYRIGGHGERGGWIVAVGADGCVHWRLRDGVEPRTEGQWPWR